MPCQLDMDTKHLWHVFLCAEAVFHIVAIFIGILFVVVFSKLKSVHIHLVLVLDSFVLAFCVTSVFRLHYSLRAVILNLIADDDSLMFSSTLRDVGMFAGGLHMLLVAGERVIATFRAKTYEQESGILAVICSVVLSWLFSFFVMLVVFTNSPISRFLAAGIYVVADVAAIIMMYCVRKRSLRLWREFKGKLKITHSYQVRENVRTSLFLCRAFGIFALQSFVAIVAYLTYSYCCYVDDYPILLRVSGFVFDVAIAIVPITISVMICIVHVQLRESLKKVFCKSRYQSKPQVEDLVDFDGKKIAVNPLQETAVYFEQFRSAWA